jgi:hypothetical protein
MKKNVNLNGDYDIRGNFSKQTIRFWRESKQKEENDSLSEEEVQINSETKED